MLRWQALVLAVSGCYSPTPPSGAPCSNGECPTGLECIADVCVQPGMDAPPEDAASDDAIISDAESSLDAPFIDTDGDGVVDKTDNCPLVSNPGQRDHDVDSRGDVCDVCPHISDDGSDLDADGVGDLCDSSPTNNRDRLVLFEGFYDGVPLGWIPNGPISEQPGVLRVDLEGSERANISAPLVPPEKAVLVGSVTPLSNIGPDSRGIGIAMPQTPGTEGGLGVACELVYAVNGATPGLAIVNLGQNAFASSMAYPFTMGQPYRLTLVRRNNEFSCSVEGGAGSMTLVATISNQQPVQPRFGFRAKGMTGTIDYLVYIETD